MWLKLPMPTKTPPVDAGGDSSVGSGSTADGSAGAPEPDVPPSVVAGVPVDADGSVPADDAGGVPDPDSPPDAGVPGQVA